MNDASYQNALGRLREALATLRLQDKTYNDIVKARELVLARYQPIFALDHLDVLTPDEFKSFLYIENNRHWSGLYRKGGRACEDMSNLREALRWLFDESGSIDERLEKTIRRVPGMGRALATAILLVVFPDRYGVWNNTSEAGLRSLEIWPEFERGEHEGQRYLKINQVLVRLSRDLDIDLWTLDALWWSLPALQDGEAPPVSSQQAVINQSDSTFPGDAQRFALERHLQDFLLDNWDRTQLGRDWAIYSEDGDEIGNEYPTDVGRIDLLAKHRREKRWLVVELKRNQTSDATVGQVLRYIGWVKRHVAKPDERVEGLVIAHEADDSIRYALSAIQGVSLMEYKVEFHLSLVSDFGSAAG